MKTTLSPIPKANRLSPEHTILFGRPCRVAFDPPAAPRRRTNLFRLAGFVCFLALSPCLPSSAATLLVWPDSPNPTPPYTNWATAAQTIQAGVDAAQAGDTVLVTNGIYATGGRAVYGTMTNRVAVDRPIVLQSVNGPEVTVIQGYKVLGTTNGDGAVRCVYLANGAVLSGFTLTNGATRVLGAYDLEVSGGGVFCQSTNPLLTNCTLTDNSAYWSGGGVYSGTLIGCTLMNNSAQSGGGAYSSALNNCTLTGNSAISGGGASSGTLSNCTLVANSASYGGGGTGVLFNNCTLTGNSASQTGGGAASGTLNSCILTGNYASREGGGADGAIVNNCILAGNWATNGGGAASGKLNNCSVTGNSAQQGGGTYLAAVQGSAFVDNTASIGGGAYYGTINNCTLTGNSAQTAGGVFHGTLYNSIVYYNTAFTAPNYDSSTFNYCCTTPLPGSGTGNINAEPQLASASHLSATSPCRGAGSAAYATGLDIDGEIWLNPPSIGCDEYWAGAITGAITAAIEVTWTNVAAGFALDLTGLTTGRVAANVWDFGDGTVVSNRPYASHAWANVGDFTVMFTAYNESHAEGVSASTTVRVVAQPVHYVSAGSRDPVPPYESWANAASTIQDAVDAVTTAGALVLVTNGVYVTGGRALHGTMTNRVAVDRPLLLQSVNGPQETVIQGFQLPGSINGDGAVRCVSLASGAVLSGFTVTGGATRVGGDPIWDQSGGGVWAESASVVITDCVLAGNSAAYAGGAAFSGTLNNCSFTTNSALTGGGAASGTANNCSLAGNSAQLGGGVYAGTLNACTVTGNSALRNGGGAYGSVLNNSILYYNQATSDANYDSSTVLNYSCTIPQPGSGIGNIIAEPQLASASRLSANSPCRQAGSPAYATGVDIDGEPWLNPPSIGCDEYWSGAITGAITAAIEATWTNVAVGFRAGLTARITGRVTASAWDFGDGTIVSNRPYASHAWAAAGDYSVVLWAYNESHPGGMSATLTIRVGAQPIYYVSAGSANPLPPYSSWDTAARVLQDAVDVAAAGASVLVGDGIYASGGRAVFGAMTNRVAVDRPLLVQSVNGPAVTVIEGYQVPGTTKGDGAIRCAYLTNGAILSGFTLTNGATRAQGDPTWEQSGGGVWGESTNALVTNCTVIGNSAAYAGGGACFVTLNNCLLSSNTATYGGAAIWNTLTNCTLLSNAASQGGGVYAGTLSGCTLAGNLASVGGGAFNSTLTDCTITGNSARSSGGGGSGSILKNCTVTGNSAAQSGGGTYYGTLGHCTLMGNSGAKGGGAYSGVLSDCVLTGNSGQYGGAAYSGTLTNCSLTNNSAQYGGGMYAAMDGGIGTLNNCLLGGNSAQVGGGVCADFYTHCILNNCTVTGNSASQNGGGAYYARLNNCIVTANSAQTGGASYLCVLYNCTVTGNSALLSGGGDSRGTLANCILYYNTANSNPNYDSSTLNYCCTTPLPVSGAGNLSAEPLLASASHLSAGSPCRAAGSAAYATGLDVDGEAWLNPPSIGCDEYRAGAVTGAVEVAIGASTTSVAVGAALNLTAQINGQLASSRWDFGDGTIVSNRLYASHAWGTAGDYTVVLSAYNESHPEGVGATLTVHVLTQPIHYVSADSTSPLPPYSSWATAAQTIQDAIDAAAVGGVVLVTNGIYTTGGRAIEGLMTNRVAVDKPLVLRSVNGPAVTFIQGWQVPGTTNGDGAVRCVYLTNGAMMAGFTLTNGATRAQGGLLREQTGGGVWCQSASPALTNCSLVHNSASYGGGGATYGTLNNCTLTGNTATNGGGAWYGTLNNCLLVDNSARNGGGAFYAILNNCTVVGNWSTGDYGSGGGVYSSSLTNCIIYYNLAGTGTFASDAPDSMGVDCCASGIGSGYGNINQEPRFVDRLNGNLRLQSNSPCINRAYASPPGPTDLDGRPRIVNVWADMGAYEYQGPGFSQFIPWLAQYGLPTDGSADYTDPDGDGLNNWQEWLCGTDPTNAFSALRLLAPTTNLAGIAVTWLSLTNHTYSLDRATNLAAHPAFSRLATGIPGQPGTTTYTDTNAPNPGPSFYRISIPP